MAVNDPYFGADRPADDSGATSAAGIHVSDSSIGLVGRAKSSNAHPDDETDAFLRAATVMQDNPGTPLLFDGNKKYGHSNPTWMRNTRIVDIRANLCEWQNVNTVSVFGVDTSGLNTNPGLHWNTTSNPRTPGTIHNGYLINTVAAWGTTVTVSTLSDAANLSAGDWVYISSRCIELGGFPPNALYRDFNRVRSVDELTGIITLWWPLKNTHRSDQYDYTDGNYYVGKARIRNLSRSTGFTFCESLYIENLRLLDNPTFPNESINGGWGDVYLTGCFYAKLKNLDIGNFVVSENCEAWIENCRSFTNEFDKACGKIYVIGGEHSVLAGGSGVDKITAFGVTARDYLAVDSESLLAIGCSVSGNDNGGQMLSGTGQYVRLFGNDYTRRAGLTGTVFSYPQSPITLPAAIAVTTTTMTYDRNSGDFWGGIKGLRKGVLLYLTSETGKRGVVTDLYYNGTHEVIEVAAGWVGGTPSPGDTLTYKPTVSWHAHGEINRYENPARPLENSKVAFPARVQDTSLLESPIPQEFMLVLPNDVDAHAYDADGIIREIEICVAVAQSGKTVNLGFPARATTAWQANHAYALAALVTNGGKNYYCVTAGTSAGSGGPTGTGTAITDNTATWNYAGTVGAEQNLGIDCSTAHTVKIDQFGVYGMTGGDSFANVTGSGGFAPGGCTGVIYSGTKYLSMGGSPTAIGGYLRISHLRLNI